MYLRVLTTRSFFFFFVETPFDQVVPSGPVFSARFEDGEGLWPMVDVKVVVLLLLALEPTLCTGAVIGDTRLAVQKG